MEENICNLLSPNYLGNMQKMFTLKKQSHPLSAVLIFFPIAINSNHVRIRHLTKVAFLMFA